MASPRDNCESWWWPMKALLWMAWPARFEVPKHEESSSSTLFPPFVILTWTLVAPCDDQLQMLRRVFFDTREHKAPCLLLSNTGDRFPFNLTLRRELFGVSRQCHTCIALHVFELKTHYPTGWMPCTCHGLSLTPAAGFRSFFPHTAIRT